MFNWRDSKTGNNLYLSNFPLAVPGCTKLQELKVQSVLSVLQFDKYDGTDQLASAYEQGAMSGVAHGVVYHHLDIPDLQSPALLHDYGAFNVFEEATVFIDEGM